MKIYFLKKNSLPRGRNLPPSRIYDDPIAPDKIDLIFFAYVIFQTITIIFIKKQQSRRT